MSAGGGGHSLGRARTWLIAWLVTRIYMLSLLGVWRHSWNGDRQDIGLYQSWSAAMLQSHHLPTDPQWQYPPAAALVLLAPRLWPGQYPLAFVLMMLAIDAGTSLVLARASRRSGTNSGMWLWLLALPVLGWLPLLRFDLVPTGLAVAALVVGGVRLSGALAGIGAAVKVWPALLLLRSAHRDDRSRAVRAALISGGSLVGLVSLAFGNPLAFVGNQGGRGIEFESVAASPWYVWQLLSGHRVAAVHRYGAWEITGAGTGVVSRLLTASLVIVLAGTAASGWARYRPGHSPGPGTNRAAAGAEAAFSAVLLFTVTSRVLSPQYEIWLIGVAAGLLTVPGTRLRRPVRLVVASVVLTQLEYSVSGAVVGGNRSLVVFLLARNAVLLAATALAVRECWAVRQPTTGSTTEHGGGPEGPVLNAARTS